MRLEIKCVKARLDLVTDPNQPAFFDRGITKVISAHAESIHSAERTNSPETNWELAKKWFAVLMNSGTQTADVKNYQIDRVDCNEMGINVGFPSGALILKGTRVEAPLPGYVASLARDLVLLRELYESS